MKVLFFSPYARSHIHLEALLEVATEHVNAKDEVHVIQCRKELPVCDANQSHKPLYCLECLSLSNRGLDILGIPTSRRHALKVRKIIRESELPRFRTLRDLVQFHWNNVPVGQGVAASVLTCLTRDTETDLEAHGKFVSKMIAAYISTYDAFKRMINEQKPDLVYVYNGRVGINHAGFQAAKDSGVLVRGFDRENYHSYFVTEDAMVADIHWAKREIAKAAKRMPLDPNSVERSADWFIKNRFGNQVQVQNYIYKQKRGVLPENWNPQKINIVIFGSSEDEILGTEGLKNPFFESSAQAVEYITQQIKDPRYYFYFRAHPNLIGLNNAQNRQARKLHAENLTVILPDSTIDSYALADAATRVVTFGSTMGLEAAFWNKPSILAGRSFYEDLGATYNIRNQEELIALIQQDLTPLGREKTFPYAYWLLTKSLPFKHVVPNRPDCSAQTLLHGIVIMPSRLVRIIKMANYRLRRLMQNVRPIPWRLP